MDTLYISEAYKFVAIALMLTELNCQCGKLHLPGWKPITGEDVVRCFVAPPRLLLGGSNATTNAIYGFGHEGRLQFMSFSEPNSDLPLKERHDLWAAETSLVGTNDAYRIATNWLYQLDIDVHALEGKCAPHIVQQYYYPDFTRGNPGRRVLLPCFDVKWGLNENRPDVLVSIFGPTSEPLEIRIRNTSFSKRASGFVGNIEKLLSLKDDEFAQYNQTVRSNLVFESHVNEYDRIFLPDKIPTSARERENKAKDN